MQEFILNLKSIDWWLSVVLFGILINISSSYIKPFIDKQISRLLENRKRSTQERNQHIENKVKQLIEDKSRTELIRLEIHRNRFTFRVLIYGVSMLICSVLISGVGPVILQYLFGFIALLFSSLSIASLNESKQIGEIIKEYYRITDGQ